MIDSARSKWSRGGFRLQSQRALRASPSRCFAPTSFSRSLFLSLPFVFPPCFFVFLSPALVESSTWHQREDIQRGGRSSQPNGDDPRPSPLALARAISRTASRRDGSVVDRLYLPVSRFFRHSSRTCFPLPQDGSSRPRGSVVINRCVSANPLFRREREKKDREKQRKIEKSRGKRWKLEESCQEVVDPSFRREPWKWSGSESAAMQSRGENDSWSSICVFARLIEPGFLWIYITRDCVNNKCPNVQSFSLTLDSRRTLLAFSRHRSFFILQSDYLQRVILLSQDPWRFV